MPPVKTIAMKGLNVALLVIAGALVLWLLRKIPGVGPVVAKLDA